MAKRYTKLSQILKKLLFDKGMSGADLARAVNMPIATIHRLVSGASTRPYKKSLEPIAEYFSISTDQLLGEEPIFDWHSSDLVLSGNIKPQFLPVIEWNEANKISSINAFSKNRKISLIGDVSKESFALIMNDHSMEPLFPKDTILLFDPKQKPTDRSYVLANLKDRSLPIFRQFITDIEHNYLKPLNPDLKMILATEDTEIIACLIESRINHEPKNY